MFINIFCNLSKKCTHDKVAPEVDFAYCPDCGELIHNEWYITRCKCCGIKLKTITRNSTIIPAYKYCSNCGESEYVIEKIDKISFIDINFAVLIKNIKKEVKNPSTIQCWQEKTNEQPKLLMQFQ